MATQKDFRIKNGLEIRGGNIQTTQGGLNLVHQVSGDSGQIIINNGQFGNSFMRLGQIGGGDANSFIRTDRTLEFHIGQSATSTTPSVSIDTSGKTTITSSGTIGGNTPANGYLKITDGTGTLALDTNEVHTTENLFLNAEDGTIYLRGNDSGAVTLKNGSITFMTTTRDLQNIGTISNSAFTIPNSIGSAGQVLKVPSSGTTLEWGNDTGLITSITNFADNRLLTASGSTTINGESGLLFGHTSDGQRLDISLGGQSGSATGTGYIGNTSSVVGGNSNDFVISGTNQLVLGSQGYGRIYIDGSTVNISSGLHVGGTQVITSTRNLTNIGTISSGAITSSGNVNLTTGDLQIGGSTTITSDKDAYLRQAFLQHSTPNVKLIDTDGTNKQGVVKFNDGVLTLQSKNNTSNGTIKFEGDNGTTVTEYGRFDAFGRFGIGSTPSNYALEVYDNSNILLKLASSTATNNARMVFAINDSEKWNVGVQYANSDFTFYDITNGATPFRIEQGASENTLMVDVNSRVGMGLNNPATRVHIKDDSSPVLRVEDGTNNVKTDIGSTDTQGYIGTNTAHPFMIRYSNTDSYRFDSAKQMYHGNFKNPEKLMFGGSVETYQYLDTRDYMVKKGHHASSGFVIFFSGEAHKVTPYLDNTNIYINGNLHISNASAFSIQDISASDLSQYDVITADKPIVVTANQPRRFASPISFGGHILGGFTTRYYPIIFRLYAPFSKVDVEIYRSSSTTVDISGTPSYTGTINAGGGLEITESGASGTNYWVIKATGYIVGAINPTGGDNILLPPIGQEVLTNSQATSVLKINDGTNTSQTFSANNNGAYYYRENSGDRELGIGAFGTADGAGGDAEFGIPLEFLSDYYIFPQTDITNFRLASYTANKIQVLDKDGNRLYAYDHSAATKEVPLFAEEGSSSGNGSALNSNGAFRFIGTAPFHLVCQSTSDYECVQIGALQSELDEVQSFGGGFVPNSISSNSDLAINTDTLFVDVSANKVGIGEDSLDAKLHISDATLPNIKLERLGVKKFALGVTGTDFRIDGTNDDLSTPSFTIDTNGAVLIEKTVDSFSVEGAVLNSGGTAGKVQFGRTNGQPLALNRLGSSDGAIVGFYKANNIVGNVGVDNSDNLVIEGNSTHSGLNFATDVILPYKNGALISNTISLGNDDYKFASLTLNGTAKVNEVSINGTTVINSARNLLNITNLVVDNIDLGGSAITVASGNFTVDVAGDIELNADGGDITFVDGSTEFGRVFGSSDNFYIQSRQSDKDLIFQGNDGGSTITALTLDMSEGGTATFNHDIKLSDNGKATFGTSGDAEIYHNGTHLYIDEKDAGRIFIRSSNEIRLNKYTGEYMIRAIADGAVELYHDNSPKLQTTSGGVSVSGELNTTGTINIDTADTTLPNTYFSAERFNDADGKLIFGAGELDPAGGTTGETFIGNHNRPVHIGAVYDGSQNPTASVRHLRIDTDGSLRVSLNNTHTKWFDASTRNLTNIGTISSGAISSSGNLTLTQSSGNNTLYLNSSGGGNPVIYMEDSTRKWGQFVSSGTFYLKNETANIETLKLENNGNITFVGNMNIGGAGNNNVRVRHIEGKDSASSNYGPLFLNYTSTQNVQIGHSGNLNDLYIYGTLRTGGTARIDNSGNLTNIGTISSDAVTIQADASNEQLTIKRASNTNEQLIFGFHSDDYGWIQSVEQGVAYRPLVLNRDGGTVSIGDSSPPSNVKLAIQGDGIGIRLDGSANTTRSIFFRNTTSSNPAQIYADGSLRLRTEDSATDILFHTNSTGTDNEAMRINGSRHVLVGRTSTSGVDTDGHVLFRTGASYQSANSSNTASVQYLNKNGDNGDLIQLYKSGTHKANIGLNSHVYLSHQDGKGLGIDGTRVFPTNADGTAITGSMDLGLSSFKFRDLYLSGTVNATQFKWNTDGSGTNYLGSDIYDGLVLHSRPDESIKYGAGETVSGTKAHIFYSSTTNNTTGLGNEVFSIKAGGDISALGGNLTITDVTGSDNYTKIAKTNTGSNLAVVSQESIYMMLDENNDQTNRGFYIKKNAGAPASGDLLFSILESGAATFTGAVETGTLTIASGSHISFEALQGDIIKWDSTYLNIGAAEADDFKTRLRGFGGASSIILDDNFIDITGTSHGVLVNFITGTTTEGSIGSRDESSYNLFMEAHSGTSAVGFKIHTSFGSHYISPSQDQGATADNMLRLGYLTNRYVELYAVDGSINTSDRNEKQDIQELSDAEQRVATACKGLIRRYKWNHAVEEKGDDARYHFGIIAQDLQDAFTTEGLDAGDYGMFISDTWTNDDGVEQTRLGVRYNELLAFIIATL